MYRKRRNLNKEEVRDLTKSNFRTIGNRVKKFRKDVNLHKHYYSRRFESEYSLQPHYDGEKIKSTFECKIHQDFKNPILEWFLRFFAHKSEREKKTRLQRADSAPPISDEECN